MRRWKSAGIKNYLNTPIGEKSDIQYDKTLPVITVVVPSFNQEKYIERTIRSIINQNYPKLRLVVVDGGSTDGSIEIIKKYKEFIDFWVSEKDAGQADAINKGFKIATGDLVGWLNSDDIYLPNAFYNIVEAYNKNKDCDVFYGNTYIIDENDEILEEARTIPFYLDQLVCKGWNLSSQSVFWKKNVFEKIGYLNNYNVLFDLDWFIRLGRVFRFKFIHEFIGCYRYQKEAKLSTIKQEYREVIFKIIMEGQGYPFGQENMWDGKANFRKISINLRRFLWFCFQGDCNFIGSRFIKKLGILKKN